MIYCRKCLMPDTRPNGHLNAEDVCTACAFYADPDRVNYGARFNELRQIVRRKPRAQRHRRWQCIVGVTGGKDSTRQALWVREKLKANPLLISVVYPPRHISGIGADNLSNVVRLGFDTLGVGPAPRLSRELRQAGRNREAVQLLSNQVTASLATRHYWIICESLIEVAEDLAPLDARQAGLLGVKAREVARGAGLNLDGLLARLPSPVATAA